MSNFDYSTLLEAAGGDEALVGELIGIFREQYPTQVSQMENAIRELKPDELHRAAHALRGALGNLGAHGTVDIVLALEHMAINNDLEKADEALVCLKNQLESLAQELTEQERTLTK